MTPNANARRRPDRLGARRDATFQAQKARAVVLRSASGGRVWSAGHDVDELPKAGIDPLPCSDPLEQLLRGVKALPAQVIAMVQGSVWGGACELVMVCDLVVATKPARSR
jgi:methylmalonyl-CoA decarboxylase